MPDAKEVTRLRVAQARRAEKSKRSAIVVSGHHFGEFGVLDAEGRSSILRFRPVHSTIMRHGNLGMTVGIYVAQINGVVLARGDRWIAAGADAGAIGNGAHNPGQTIVSGNGNAGPADACCILAFFIRDVSSAVGRYANVSMQAAARTRRHRKIDSVNGRECVNGNAWPKRYAAIITA